MAPRQAEGEAVERARGTVRVVGTGEAPRVVLADSAGGERELTGPLAAELARVARAEVSVEGVAAAPAPALEVRSYTIESIDGRRPVVGTLLARAGGLALAAADTLELVGAGEELGRHEGATVWVAGARDGGRLTVAAYGVLRERR